MYQKDVHQKVLGFGILLLLAAGPSGCGHRHCVNPGAYVPCPNNQWECDEGYAPRNHRDGPQKGDDLICDKIN
jgi:hypothetical protein